MSWVSGTLRSTRLRAWHEVYFLEVYVQYTVLCRVFELCVLPFSGGAWNTCACDGVMASPYLVIAAPVLHRRDSGRYECAYKGAVQCSVNCVFHAVRTAFQPTSGI